MVTRNSHYALVDKGGFSWKLAYFSVGKLFFKP